MRITLKKWGNNAAVRLPAAIMEAACFQLDQILEVRAEGGRVIIEAIDPYAAEPPAVDIEAICANLHPEGPPELVDFGRPVGQEDW